jgi:hypothetical protein
VEFFGIPRQRAGCAELRVPAATVAEVLAAVEHACPGLTGLRQPDGRLAPHYLLSVDGRRFVGEPGECVRPGERLLLLSADVGG